MAKKLKINVHSSEIVYGGKPFSSRSKNAFVVIAYLAWRHRRQLNTTKCEVKNDEIAASLQYVKSGTRPSPDAMRKMMERLVAEIKAADMDFLGFHNSTAGPFWLKNADIKFDVKDSEVAERLGFAGVKKNSINKVDFGYPEMIRVCKHSILLSKDIQGGEFPGNGKARPGLDEDFVNIVNLKNSQELRLAAFFLEVEYMLRLLKYDKAKALLKKVDRLIHTQENSDTYVRFKAALYHAWVCYRAEEFDACKEKLEVLDASTCDDQKLLALYHNLFGRVILENFKKQENRGKTDWVVAALKHHEKAALCQIHANHMDGLQGTLSGMARTYFDFMHNRPAKARFSGADIAFRFLILSMMIRQKFEVGGYSVDNAIIFAEGMLSTKKSFEWAQRMAEEMSSAEDSVLKNYKSLRHFIEQHIEPAEKIGNAEDIQALKNCLAIVRNTKAHASA